MDSTFFKTCWFSFFLQQLKPYLYIIFFCSNSFYEFFSSVNCLVSYLKNFGLNFFHSTAGIKLFTKSLRPSATGLDPFMKLFSSRPGWVQHVSFNCWYHIVLHNLFSFNHHGLTLYRKLFFLQTSGF